VMIHNILADDLGLCDITQLDKGMTPWPCRRLIVVLNVGVQAWVV
jgi:hypothetical protein